MSRRRYIREGTNTADRTIVENYTKDNWWNKEQLNIDFQEDTEIYGHLEGSNRRIYLGTPTSVFDLVSNNDVQIMGQWSFSGINHYCFRTLWKTRTVFNFKEPMFFDFTISVKNGLHIWNEDKTIDCTINDEESKTLIRSFVGNAVLHFGGRGKIDYIKSRKLKEQ